MADVLVSFSIEACSPKEFSDRLLVNAGGAPDLELDPDGGITAGRDGLDDFYEAFYNWPLLCAPTFPPL